MRKIWALVDLALYIPCYYYINSILYYPFVRLNRCRERNQNIDTTTHFVFSSPIITSNLFISKSRPTIYAPQKQAQFYGKLILWSYTPKVKAGQRIRGCKMCLYLGKPTPSMPKTWQKMLGCLQMYGSRRGVMRASFLGCPGLICPYTYSY